VEGAEVIRCSHLKNLFFPFRRWLVPGTVSCAVIMGFLVRCHFSWGWCLRRRRGMRGLLFRWRRYCPFRQYEGGNHRYVFLAYLLFPWRAA